MEGRLTEHLHLTKPATSSRLDAGVLNGHVRTLNRDLDILDAAIGAVEGGVVGPPGPAGPAGPTGPAGPQGPAGESSATVVDAKGDLLAGSAPDTLSRVPVGADGTVLTADSTASTGVAWAAPAATQTLLVNGGFEVHQRGGTVSATGAYAHDRWQLLLGGTSTMTVTDETSLVDVGSGHALKAVYVHNAASRIDQKLEGYAQLRGRTVSFRVRVRQGVANSARAYVEDSGTRTYSATQAATGSYLTFAVTLAVGAASTSVRVGVELGASDTVYVDNASLVVGSLPVPYAPLDPATELARCMRYYETLGGAVANEMMPAGRAASATVGMFNWVFAVPKATTPTLSASSAADFLLQSAAANHAGTSVAYTSPCVRSVRVDFTAAGGGMTAHWALGLCAANTNARLVAEANPP